MISVLKSIARKLGIRRVMLENFWFKLDCRFPTRFLDVWALRPSLIFRWAQNTLARRTMMCFPNEPGEVGYELMKLAMVLGVRLTREAKQPQLAMAWQDVTVRTVSLTPLEAKCSYVLNSRCPDIGKDRIEEVFESVFGYALRIDPTTHQGLCVRKSILNAKHDGVVLQCPIEKAEPGFVYQRLINNQTGGEEIIDLRTPCYDGALPLVYLKYRPIRKRFGDINARVTLAKTEEVFSAEERELIVKFARALKLDYGGMDVLRDNETKKIYIVDVNTTPFGPPKELSHGDKTRALGILASTFHKQFIARPMDARGEKSASVQNFAASP